jgi:hypothetical protein
VPNAGAKSVAENLRRIARRLRGEAVEGLESLDPSDPFATASLLEHEASHLAPGRRDPALRLDPDLRGREVRFEADDGRERTGTVAGWSGGDSAHLVVESGGARYRVHGCMVRHLLTEEEGERVRKDWLAWTGGHPPSECPPEDVDRYVELAAPAGLPPSAVEACLSAWGEEGG